MDKSEIETLLSEHVRRVHVELQRLFRGIEEALDDHLAAIEEAIARALQKARQ